MKYKHPETQGFALPTVLIASVIMLTVLVTAVQAVNSVSVSLSNQYYNTLAREAAESGIAKAQACLQASSYIPSWSDSSPLTPQTDCSGAVQSTYPATLSTSGDTATTFTVGASQVSNGSQVVTATGTVNRLRTSDGTAWRTYTTTNRARVGAIQSFSNVLFGYSDHGGAFFATQRLDGQLYTTGYNGDGQLGIGSLNSVLTPTRFQTPDNLRVTHSYTNFLELGYSIFAIMSDGSVYGSGQNAAGQLGNGTTAANQTTPVKFVLPAGVSALQVGVLGTDTYVFGSDNNLYAAGNCRFGELGYNYTISGCTNQATAVRVALPTPSASDPNTLPALTAGELPPSNIALDRENAYLRMQGGAVYTWGNNDYGQLANGTTADSSVPIKIGTFGDAGQPKATQVVFNGGTWYVLGNDGTVWSGGQNNYGQIGSAGSQIIHSTGLCLNNAHNLTTTQPATIYACQNATSQQIYVYDDGNNDGYARLEVHPNASTALCIENANGATTNGNTIQQAPCTGGAAQRWKIVANPTDKTFNLMNPASGKCIDDPSDASANNTQLQLWTCSGSANQTWSFDNSTAARQIQLPAAAGPVAKISSDKDSVIFMTTNGQVYGVGDNDWGQLGSSTLNRTNPVPVKLPLPAGRTAKDIYTTKVGNDYSDGGTSIADTYVVLDNGQVIGVGANQYGQLGNGTTSSTPVSTPVVMQLPAGVQAKSVQSGYGTTVVLATDGTIYTVGNNASGQLGDGTTNNSSIPKANIYTNVLPVQQF